MRLMNARELQENKVKDAICLKKKKKIRFVYHSLDKEMEAVVESRNKLNVKNL